MACCYLKAAFYLWLNFHSGLVKKVCAEMRGVSDQNGHSPFWENVGRHFFGMDFDKADRENGEGNNQFIAELMPHHPVYVPMLSKDAQAAIGRVHEDTKPAVQILKAEGFRYSGYVDIFDAGPTIEAPLTSIRTVRKSMELEATIGEVDSRTVSNAMICNTKFKGFRATLSQVAPPIEQKVTISESCAKALNIKSGDKVRVRF